MDVNNEGFFKPEQEPVGYLVKAYKLAKELSDHLSVAPSPPQRTWVGLTEQERNEIEDYCEMMIGKPAFDAIEDKLKEKNQ